MKEVGYAHSSDDRQDNRTCRERRGIRIDSVFKERSTFTLGEALEKKRKSQMSDEERVRDFQRKLYRKAKQEESYKKSQRKSRLCNQGAYKTLMDKFGLIKVTNWPKLLTPYEGKPHVRFEEGGRGTCLYST